MFSLLIKIKEILFNILFPPLCLNCQKNLSAENYLCADCYNSIKLNSSLFCPTCFRRLANNNLSCRHSQRYFDNGKERRFSYLLGAAGNYDDEILRNIIYYFKYKYFQNLTPLLGEIIARYIENCKLRIENFSVVPIPLHRKKEKQRGFDQAKVLAEDVAAKLNLNFISALEKTKNNKQQAQIKNREQRIKNVEGCFRITPGCNLKNKNILLVDDVFTTGATMNEAAKILKQNGARRIIALVLAKA